jgi:uncharacterized glyoxalase superfamily protein PhnB
MNKKRILILISSVIIIVIVIVIVSQSYPIAFINWQPISLKSFKADSATAIYYYQKVLETYNENQAGVIESSEVQQEIRRAVLNKLIENALIHQELRKRLKNNELERMVENKIEETIKGKEIKKEVKILYDLSLDKFKERILKPQAEEEILAGRLLLENNLPAGGFDDWLKEIKSKAKVIILLPNFEWTGQVIIK